MNSVFHDPGNKRIDQGHRANIAVRLQQIVFKLGFIENQKRIGRPSMDKKSRLICEYFIYSTENQ